MNLIHLNKNYFGGDSPEDLFVA